MTITDPLQADPKYWFQCSGSINFAILRILVSNSKIKALDPTSSYDLFKNLKRTVWLYLKTSDAIYRFIKPGSGQRSAM
jgi:hypothetical protein